MTCVQWLTNPGGPLGVLGTNVIPLGCKGAPCTTTCSDSYVKLIDLASAGAGVAVIAFAGLGTVGLVIGALLILFAVMSIWVLPNITIPGLFGFGNTGLNWY